jgi:hypothetical protein
MNQLIISSDIIGLNPSILIDYKRKHSTLFGGIISILSIISIILISLFFITDFLGKKQSSVIYNYEQSRYVQRNLSQYPYTLRLATPVGGLIPDSFYYVHSELWKMKSFNLSGQVILNATRVVLVQEKCDINKHLGQYRNLFENVAYLNDSYCPVASANDLDVRTPYGESIDFNFIQHYVVKCNNDTSKNITNCSPMDKINSNLGNVFLSMNFLEYSLDHTDLISPGKISLRSEIIPMSSSIFSRVWFYITNIKYFSDDGFIFESKKYFDYFKISRPKFTYNLVGSVVPNSISVVTFTMENSFEIYEKKYMKVQSFLANVGGIIEAIWICAQIISYLICKMLYDTDLISSLFHLNSNTSELQIKATTNLNSRFFNYLKLVSSLVKYRFKKILKLYQDKKKIINCNKILK